MERFEQYRNVEVQGALGKFILRDVAMPLEVAREIWGEGLAIPMDILPNEFWWQEDLPRFGEEMLGEDF